MENKAYIAKLNNIRMSPRKLRLVVDLVKKMDLVEALQQLEHLNKKGANYVSKAVRSAAANAKHEDNIKLKNLQFAEMFVTEAMTYKRGRAVSRGRFHQIRKRGSNLTVKLIEKQ